jgi:CRP-like cAMP-binding protein
VSEPTDSGETQPARGEVHPDDADVSAPVFERLSKAQRRQVQDASDVREYPAGTVLAEQGSDGTELFVVLDGEVDVVRDGTVIATRGEGSPLGEMAVLSGTPRTASLVARSDVRMLVTPRAAFRELAHDVPVVANRLRVVAAGRRTPDGETDEGPGASSR